MRGLGYMIYKRAMIYDLTLKVEYSTFFICAQFKFYFQTVESREPC